ncbi:protein-disulfide reductase DsbD domain-containing protein, partial [Tenuifilum sp.]|uniref:protein-disulfide reductase DsbD domain-containing protein n=1 Tax=Tenuifilum sp. TaxID=2760880 RepID=UPI002BC60141|nr:disulfide bond formation protein DsbD [Tenuifilum sp.]
MKRIALIKSLGLFLLGLLALGQANAQMDDPVQWSATTKRIDASKFEVVISASIDEGWHLYSTKLPEGGPLPTNFSFEKPVGYKLIGNIKEVSKSKTEHDEIFNLDLSYFESEA